MCHGEVVKLLFGEKDTTQVGCHGLFRSKSMAIGESIKAGHDEYRRLFAKLFKTTVKDASLREELFNDYALRLYAHHEGEERLLIPKMLKIPDLKDMGYELEMEHATMKVLIKDLKTLGYDHAMWRYRLSPLYSVMKVHWDKEETQLIPFAPEYFAASALIDLGKEFDTLVEDYIKKNK